MVGGSFSRPQDRRQQQNALHDRRADRGGARAGDQYEAPHQRDAQQRAEALPAEQELDQTHKKGDMQPRLWPWIAVFVYYYAKRLIIVRKVSRFYNQDVLLFQSLSACGWPIL